MTTKSQSEMAQEYDIYKEDECKTRSKLEKTTSKTLSSIIKLNVGLLNAFKESLEELSDNVEKSDTFQANLDNGVLNGVIDGSEKFVEKVTDTVNEAWSDLTKSESSKQGLSDDELERIAELVAQKLKQ